MKKVIAIIFCIMLSTSSIHVHAKYWQNDNDNSWYMTLYATIFGKSLEKIIPELMIELDHATLQNPTHLSNPQSYNQTTCYENQNLSIHAISCPLNTGTTHEAFQQIIQNQPLLANYPIQLHYDCCNILKNTISTSCYIILDNHFFGYPDATKLFILYHELQHHIYNDIAGNHIDKLINITTDEHLKNLLIINQNILQNHIYRYAEYRSDLQAVIAFQCPHCLQEVAQMYEQLQGKENPGIYDSRGYLHAWQIQPYIDHLITEKKCCNHHQKNQKQIDLSLHDASSLLDRLIIIQE